MNTHTHSHGQFDTQAQVRRITLLGLFLNLGLGSLKCIFGFFGHSQALVADGIHGLSDSFIDIFILIVGRFSHKHADLDHPYGHGRIETVATILLAILLFTISLGIAIEAIRPLFHHEPVLQPHGSTLPLVLLSLGVNEWLFHATLRAAKQTHSPLLQANAWHRRSDAAASAVVFIGLVGSLMGYLYCDAIAAIIVALLISKIAIELAWTCLRELVDTAVDETTRTSIIHCIEQVPGVIAIHQLRSRFIAGAVFLDVHIQVNGYLTVSEGHYIAQNIQNTLITNILRLQDVTVHIDPENDELMPSNDDLPSRHQLLPRLHEYWQGLPLVSSIIETRLHYLKGSLCIEIYLPFEDFLQSKLTLNALEEMYYEQLKNESYIDQVHIFLRTGKT